MWDAQLVARVRDRKLNEMIIFASMARTDGGNVDAYVDIIVSLGDDVDACNTLLDTDGEAVIELEPLDRPEYVGRLSETERADEDAFNTLKSAPQEEAEGIEDYVRRLLSDAVESIRSEREADADAMDSVVEELRACRRRVESLSQELEYARSDAATARESLDEMTADRDSFAERCESLREELRAAGIELEEARSKAGSLLDAERDLGRVTAERDSLAAEAGDLRRSLDEAVAARCSAESALEGLAKELDDARRSAEEDRAKAESAMAAMTSERDSLAARCDSLTAELDEARSKVGSLEASAEELRGAAEEADGLRRSLSEMACRVEESTAEAEAMRADAAESKAAVKELEARFERQREEAAQLRTDLGLAEQKLSVLEPAYQEAMARIGELTAQLVEAEDPSEPEPEADVTSDEVAVAEQEAEAPPAEPGEQAEDAARAVPEGASNYISRENLEALRRIRAMKDAKMDAIMDANAKGEVDIDVCDGIVDFLKTDVAVCDALLGIDFSDRGSVIDGFRGVVDALQSSGEPRHQDEYVASLTQEEAELEYTYARVLNSVQGMMMYMRDQIM